MRHAVWVDRDPTRITVPAPTRIDGWVVEPARSLAAARVRHRSQPVDVVVLPPDAAALDGVAAVTTLGRWDPAPAIILRIDDTASPQSPLVAAALEAGVHELLGAGVTEGEPLGQALEVALHRRKTNQLATAQVAKAIARADAMAAYGGAVSHDLRGPLTTMVGIAETFQRFLEEPNDVPIELLLSMARRAAELGRDALRHTDELLEDAEVDATQLVELDLPRLVAEAWQLVDQRNVTLVIEADAAGVYGLEAGCRQVLYNLLENAARHADRDHPVVIVDVEIAALTVRLRVHDNGAGVPRARRRSIFDRDVSDTSSGLGLATVRRQLSRFGGRVWAGESHALGGAMFVAELPRPVEVNDGRSK